MKLLNKHKDGSPPGSVYIGRGSIFGNPYVIGQHGTREEVIEMYRGHLARLLVNRNKRTEEAFKELSPVSELLCFCHPKPCHGSVIDEYWTLVTGASSYEEGIEQLKERLDYRAWLLTELRNKNPNVTIDFRELELSKHLVPGRFSGYGGSGEALDKLWKEINSHGDFDKGLLAVSDTANTKTYLPVNDGVDHINIYTKGQTLLGRLLSNMADVPCVHPKYGAFRTVEGFWYYVATGFKYEEFRSLSGYDAKKQGRNYPRIPVGNFHDMVKEVIRSKIENSPDLKKLVKESTLPFTHYYFYGTLHNPKVYPLPQFDWICECITEIRTSLNSKTCRAIIAGSRDVTELEVVRKAVALSKYAITEVVSGMARGVDRLGEEYAKENSIPIKGFPADWETQGKAAGHIRNKQMADYADVLVAVWDGASPGTKNMIATMKGLGKPTYVYRTDIGAPAKAF